MKCIKLCFFQKKNQIRLCVPTLLKIFRPVTRNILFFIWPDCSFQNSLDPDQLASDETSESASTCFPFDNFIIRILAYYSADYDQLVSDLALQFKKENRDQPMKR